MELTMTDILNPQAPTPEEELADEIKAYEEEQAKLAKNDEPEPEGDGDEQEIEAASDDEDADADQDEEVEGDGEAAQESASEADKRQRQVPLKALQEERAERARLQREFDEMRGQMSAFAQMFQQQPQMQQQPDAPPPPDPEEDPIGYINYAKQQLTEINEWRQQEQQQRQQQYQLQQVQQAYQRNAYEFAQQNPDFQQVYRHLLDNRVAEMRLQGYDDQTIENALYQEELSLAVGSLQSGANPAQRIYELAKARGYRPQSKQPTPAAAKPAVDPALEERKKAAALNTNRSNPPKTPVKVEDLADLEGDKFDKAWNRIFGPESKSFV
jgi:hypothetical protein